jgi:hypothetical protein
MGKMAATMAGNYRIQLDLPPTLYRWLTGEAARRSVPLAQVVQQALERYTESETTVFDITRTRTWELCGTLEVAEPDPEYIVRYDEQGNVITNYAEHVDDQLYRGL